jgi:hypothetical protein
MNKHFVQFVGYLCFFSLAVILCGCNNGSNDPISSEEAISGTGWKLRVSSSVQNVPPGGTALITAFVTDNAGLPVANEEDVIFSSSIEGTLEGTDAGKVKTKGGVASVIYTAPAQSTNTENPKASRSNRIFASYRGALSYIEITLVATTF